MVTSRVSAESSVSCTSKSACEGAAPVGVWDAGGCALSAVLSDVPFDVLFDLRDGFVLWPSRVSPDEVFCSVVSCAAIVSGSRWGAVVGSALDWAAAVAQRNRVVTTVLHAPIAAGERCNRVEPRDRTSARCDGKCKRVTIGTLYRLRLVGQR